mmetsp:Transcript_20274/g.44288  ORF Transcript_20274/g.44288 Transcript_20274/m.44288 type:complete len:117 (+) Transcript_20274:63-413(+)
MSFRIVCRQYCPFPTSFCHDESMKQLHLFPAGEKFPDEANNMSPCPSPKVEFGWLRDRPVIAIVVGKGFNRQRRVVFLFSPHNNWRNAQNGRKGVGDHVIIILVAVGQEIGHFTPT